MRSSHSLRETQRLLRWALPCESQGNAFAGWAEHDCQHAVLPEAHTGGVEAEPHSGSDDMGYVQLTARCGFPTQNQPIGAGCPGTPLA